MAYLLDTGILLRLADNADGQHAIVTSAVRKLVAGQERLVMTLQNVCEFSNVLTRPRINNGMGLSPADAIALLEREIEPVCDVVADHEAAYDQLKRLISTYQVSGKQVHDARLVAIMLAWQIESILTLNDRDFRRYEPEGIKIITPAELIASA
jgi:predicted nucleic acid-binding protein